MASRYLPVVVLLITIFFSCKAEKPVEHKRSEPVVIVKTKPPLLSKEQQHELGFPADLIAQIELAAGADAEPFFATDVISSENMKGEKGFEQERLAGFSVRTKKTDEIIAMLRAQLRARGYLIFKSHKGYGSLPDIVTVIKGSNSYDILKMQRTEAPNYQLDTKSIIAWLKEQQKQGTFVIAGAGPDWLEARFIRQPKSMQAFAKKVVTFAPDVLDQGPKTVDKLVERMNRTNGFYLLWD